MLPDHVRVGLEVSVLLLIMNEDPFDRPVPIITVLAKKHLILHGRAISLGAAPVELLHRGGWPGGAMGPLRPSHHCRCGYYSTQWEQLEYWKLVIKVLGNRL